MGGDFVPNVSFSRGILSVPRFDRLDRNSPYHNSNNPSAITCLSVPVSADSDSDHGFEYSSCSIE